MKLRQVLKGHMNDKLIIVDSIFGRIEWRPQGIVHIMESNHVSNWLDFNVKNVTKDWLGRTIISVE